MMKHCTVRKLFALSQHFSIFFKIFLTFTQLTVTEHTQLIVMSYCDRVDCERSCNYDFADYE
jgi:hypothetical protein